MHITTRKLTAAAVTGAAYAALTMLLAPISYGAIQCRVSEVLCILPFFIPQAPTKTTRCGFSRLSILSSSTVS